MTHCTSSKIFKAFDWQTLGRKRTVTAAKEKKYTSKSFTCEDTWDVG